MAPKNNNEFHHDFDIKDEYMQLSKFCSTSLDVITIYRSQNACHEQLIRGIKKLITLDKPCLVIGDFNFCYQQQKTQTQNFFTKYNFIQLVKEPTHIEGHILDQAYLQKDVRNIDYITEIHA